MMKSILVLFLTISFFNLSALAEGGTCKSEKGTTIEYKWHYSGLTGVLDSFMIEDQIVFPSDSYHGGRSGWEIEVNWNGKTLLFEGLGTPNPRVTINNTTSRLTCILDKLDTNDDSF